jgi:hypothetical protein
MPELSRDSRPAQPIDSTMLSTIIAMPTLSESAHGDRFKEVPATPIGNVARMVLAPPVDQPSASTHSCDALALPPCSTSTWCRGVEGLAIDGRLQRHGGRVAQGGHGEAGRFGHRDELGQALGRFLTVERHFGVNRVAPRLRITSEDGAGAGVPRRDLDTNVFRLYMERACHLHELRGESKSHRDGEVAQKGGRTVRPPDAP